MKLTNVINLPPIIFFFSSSPLNVHKRFVPGWVVSNQGPWGEGSTWCDLDTLLFITSSLVCNTNSVQADVDKFWLKSLGLACLDTIDNSDCYTSARFWRLYVCYHSGREVIIVLIGLIWTQELPFFRWTTSKSLKIKKTKRQQQQQQKPTQKVKQNDF